MAHSCFAVLFALVAVRLVSGQNNSTYRDGATLVQPTYQPLTLGSVKPLGWFKDQLELEAAGLGGNMFDFYRFVHDSRWIGGSTEYSALDEASPYWFNGMVPLAFGLGDENIQSQVKYYLDYVLDHQQDDGWLGFETTEATRGLWARCLLLLGLIQYAEADPSQTERIVDAMHRYVVLAHSMLQNNYTGLIVHGNDTFDTAGFGVGRTHEMHIPLQWLYEKYPRNNSQIIWETMELMIDGGVSWGADWRTFWVEGVYPPVLYDTTPYDLSWVFIHGVNMAEGLRYPLSIYRMTSQEALREQTRTAVDLLAKYHRSLAGTIIADEYISDLNPSRGAELCIAAEVMFSSAYIYQYLGDNDIADWAEQTAFNALPVSVAADWWSHQYVQQENQPWSRNLSSTGFWSDVDSYANVFGLEPNYPCCTVNHPQGYPKFLANSFVSTGDGGLAHVFLIPATMTTTLDGENAVSVSADTNYPFSQTIKYNISATSPFDFYVRIPTWAGTNSTIRGNGNTTATTVSPSSQGLQKIEVPSGQATTFTLDLEASPRVVTRANNTAAIYYGSLLYALAIEYESSSRAPINYHTEDVLPANTTDSHTHDFSLTPTSPWNIAIDPTQIKVVRTNTTSSSSLPNPIWDLGAPPAELRVAAVEIDWPVAFDTAADPPANPAATGNPFSARFVPYASAKLHMAHLPVLQLSTVDL
ncbi:duf1680 domain-containing protein [Viridothelium virens]|uniref:Duf1680 domain-containing protein n=1 Tax=Viridothelium virens TaxID=1048519 RepID=A0A6A6HN44_VIRVR|nr:duf1680 domain-containing protein [Viridothelium virens]